MTNAFIRIWHNVCHSKSYQDSTLADYLTYQLIEDYHPMQPEFLDEDIVALFATVEDSDNENTWILFFDWSSNALGHGIGQCLFLPKSNTYLWQQDCALIVLTI